MPALSKRLLMPQNGLCQPPIFCLAYQRMANSKTHLPGNAKRRCHQAIQSIADTPLCGVLDWNDAMFCLTAFHQPKHIFDIVSEEVLDFTSKMFLYSGLRVSSRGPQNGDTRERFSCPCNRNDLAKDRLQLCLPQ